MNYIELTFSFSPLLPTREILIAELGEIGFESFLEIDEGLKAYIQEDQFNQEEIRKLEENDWFNGIKYVQKLIPDQNWNAVWESNFNEVIVNDKCLIRANFHPRNGGYKYEIVISPQMSFGTGHHATTKLMVARILELEIKGTKVLDIGCGTGVLAILCSKRNASKVLAVDTDDWAVNNTKENIEENESINIEVVKGSIEEVGDDGFDLILANINKNVLLRHLRGYYQKLKINGNLFLSGFYKVDENQLIEEGIKLGFKKVEVHHEDDWSLIHLKKTNDEVKS